MRVRRRLGDGAGKVEKCAVRLVVEMQVNASGAERLQRREKSHVGARPARIVKLPRATLRGQLLAHAPDRRDADAAGKQHDVLGILDQREIVARRADLERVPDAQIVENVARAAAAGGIELDRDDVTIRIGQRIKQRELPDQAVGQMNVDMGAGLVGRQLAAIGTRERIHVGVAGDVLDVGHPHVDHGVPGVFRCSGACCGRRCGHRVHAAIDRRAGVGFATCCLPAGTRPRQPPICQYLQRSRRHAAISVLRRWRDVIKSSAFEIRRNQMPWGPAAGH